MAEEIINDIYYRLDEENLTAEVIQKDDYRGDIIIPDAVVFNEITYRVTSIGECAFYDCSSLTSITFQGTIAQWEEIILQDDWNNEVPAKVVHCTDGDVEI